MTLRHIVKLEDREAGLEEARKGLLIRYCQNPLYFSPSAMVHTVEHIPKCQDHLSAWGHFMARVCTQGRSGGSDPHPL